MDLHNYQGQFEREIELIKTLPEIKEANRKIILGFVDNLLSEGIGVAKIGRYCLDLRKLNKILKKPFDKATELDIRHVVAEIEQGPLAPESKKCFKVLLRKLYRYIHHISDKGVYPPEVKWISIALPNKSKKLPEELLTDEEIQSIIRCAKCTRDKALLSALSESGCRVSEVGLMKIKHVSFEEYGARLLVQGKTGSRKVLVIASAPYLSSWINEHPKNEDPEAYLWFNQQKRECLTYSRITDIIKVAAKKAGIKKRVHPHLFRHSRATSLAPIMSESSMKQYFGWTQASKMAAVYVHLSGKNTDKAILKVYGKVIEEDTKERELLLPRECIRCKTKNEVTNKFCKLCGLPLDEETQIALISKEYKQNEANSLMNDLLKDPEVLALLAQKIK